jgi:hypothetical protein
MGEALMIGLISTTIVMSPVMLAISIVEAIECRMERHRSEAWEQEPLSERTIDFARPEDEEIYEIWVQ